MHGLVVVVVAEVEIEGIEEVENATEDEIAGGENKIERSWEHWVR